MGAGLLLGLLVLFALSPERGFFPPCPIYAVTGFYCSGCGSLRAIHYLLHGDFVRAWSFNPILLCSIPIVLAGVMSELFFSRRFSLTRIRPVFLWVLLGLILAFGVLRNLPAFDYLQPTALAVSTVVGESP
ncbi:MAG: DUF2752 domain-containing protein [Lentisphaerae bacterium]|jgi:hypothetical protein|nr:DUF2752 domain-containing protein [Lentisphaerota bacterium]